MKEEYRQLFHLFFGSAIVFFALFVGSETAVLVLFFALILGMLLMHFHLRGHSHETFEYLLEKLERKADLPGKGAFLFVLGSLVILTFSKDFDFALGVMMMLAAGDAASTIVGLKGKNSLPWNKKKTFEGFAAFVVASVVVSLPFLNLSLVILYPLFLAFVESLPLPFDDNLSIPVAALLLKFMV